MDGKLVAKILVLLTIFIGTIFVVNKIENRGMQDVSVEMEQATLPIVYAKYKGEFINTLHGYTGKVDTTYFRDAITPLDYGRTIELWADQGSEAYGTYEYELRSQYQGDLIENGAVTELNHADGYDKIRIEFRTRLEEMQEYVLVLKAMSEDKVAARYYTRIVVENEFHTQELLGFVENFNEALFSKEETAEELITASIESNEEGNNEYLNEVTIHSDIQTIRFADLNPSRLSKPIATIKEIDDSYAVIQLKYLISAKENEVTENFYVTEDYRVRYEEGNVYLLDYNRTQEALFNKDNIDSANNAFKVGVTDKENFQYLTSADEEKIAFKQARQLWYYDYEEGKITNVYGFCQDDNYTDSRVAYDENDIKILDMNDDGDITFVVYGYMNRGKHEGKVGIAVYNFIASKDKLYEVLFVENDKPYNILKEDMETLMYLNKEGEFYYFDNDSIVKVDIETKKAKVLIENVLGEYLAVSKDNHLIGYQKEMLPQDNEVITILDLEAKTRREITSNKGERIEAIGFIESDFIMGRIREEDIEVNTDKTVLCPMYTIDIIDQENNVVKSYASEGIYVVGATAKDGVVYLERMTKENGIYEETVQDFITYKEKESSDKIVVNYKYTTQAYNQLYILFPNYMYITTKPKMQMTKEVVKDEQTTVKVSFTNTNKKYYAYGQGKYMAAYLNLNEAVRVAFEHSGVVIDSNGLIVWRKIAVKDYHTVASKIDLYQVKEIEDTLAACIYMMSVYEDKKPDFAALKKEVAEGKAVEEIIRTYTGRQGTDITGCDFENGLYYLCKDAPVITKFADGTYVLVTSYNGELVRYINPLEETDIVEGRELFEEKIQECGNVFISYVR